jgi:spermidine/putrescine-binding protein
LIKQKPVLQKYESNATEDRMLSGDAWIAHAWNGSIARLNLADPKFKSATLSEGMLYWTDNICIPASAPHKENAELFINFLLRPENSAQNIKTILYGMPNDSARKLLETSLRDNTIIFPYVKDASKLDMIEEMDNLNQLLDKAWTEVKMK